MIKAEHSHEQFFAQTAQPLKDAVVGNRFSELIASSRIVFEQRVDAAFAPHDRELLTRGRLQLQTNTQLFLVQESVLRALWDSKERTIDGSP